MSSTTTVRSWPAIGLGGFFASVTGYVLFSDVIGGAAINTSHVLSLAALVAAIASGHLVLARRPGPPRPRGGGDRRPARRV